MPMKRPIYPMPAFVEGVLLARGLMEAYRARPDYQQNDYIGWIIRARRGATQEKRLIQMLEELARGDTYMKMDYQPTWCRKERRSMATQSLVQRYYDSISQKGDAWQELYSDDAAFMDASQTLNAVGKTAVIQSFIPFLKGVDKVKVKQMIVAGDEACAIVRYSYVNPKGAKMDQDVAEVWKVGNGKLVRLVIYFDLTAYRNFMRS